MQKETQYLGFIISDNGIMADPDKVKVMRLMLPHTWVLEVISCIAMCSYFRFIANFSAIAKSHIGLSKKFEKFKWSKTAFDFLKDSLNSASFGLSRY